MQQYELKHWWFVSRRKIIRQVLNKLLPSNLPLKILEIGCGSGGNLSLLSEFGTVFAIEYDESARKAASIKGNYQIKKGGLPNDIPYQEKFDLICLLDVLEHIDDDVASITTIKSLLNKDGKILITVPAYNFLWSYHDIEHHHKRRYTLKQIKKILQQLDLKIAYSTYFNTFLFPLVLLVRIKNKLFNINETSDLSMPTGITNKILQVIFSFEKKIIPRLSLPFGVSILIIT